MHLNFKNEYKASGIKILVGIAQIMLEYVLGWFVHIPTNFATLIQPFSLILIDLAWFDMYKIIK